jgi:hypothetical protein
MLACISWSQRVAHDPALARSWHSAQRCVVVVVIGCGSKDQPPDRAQRAMDAARRRRSPDQVSTHQACQRPLARQQPLDRGRWLARHRLLLDGGRRGHVDGVFLSPPPCRRRGYVGPEQGGDHQEETHHIHEITSVVSCSDLCKCHHRSGAREDSAQPLSSSASSSCSCASSYASSYASSCASSSSTVSKSSSTMTWPGLW